MSGFSLCFALDLSTSGDALRREDPIHVLYPQPKNLKAELLGQCGGCLALLCGEGDNDIGDCGWPAFLLVVIGQAISMI